MRSIWNQFETTRAWQHIQSAAGKLGLAPELIGMLVSPRLKKKDLVGSPDENIIRLASQAASTHKVWDNWLPEDAFSTGLRLAEFAAAEGKLERCEAITAALPGNKPLSLLRRLVWRSGGSENAPGLHNIMRTTQETNWDKQMEAAKSWGKTNQETESRRLTLIKEAYPDFDPSGQKWGNYLLQRIQKAGITLKRKEPKQSTTTPDTTTLIVGETHGNPTGNEEMLKILSEQATQGATVLTVEEPQDGNWKPLMGFLMGPGRKKEGFNLLEAARKEFGNEKIAGRIATLGHAKNLGMEICFVDLPTQERKLRQTKEIQVRRRSIAYGEPFDANKPETTLGGARVLATTILRGYHLARQRSWHMATIIDTIQNGRKLVHLGGAIHVKDIANKLAKRGKTPEIAWTTGKENPLAQALGITPTEKTDLTPKQKKTKNQEHEKSYF